MTRASTNPPPPSGDLDALLGSFFKGEMPDPWPAFQPAAPARTLSLNGRAVPSRNEPSRTPSHRMLLSRMALAASVALLLLAGWFLGGSFNQSRGPVLPSLPDNGAAKRDMRFPHVVPNAPAKTPEKAKADRSSAP